MQLQNEIYILKKQLINEKNLHALTNSDDIHLRKHIKFSFNHSSESTLIFNNINNIINSKRFVKHIDLKIFIDDSEKKIDRLNSKFYK